MLRIDILYNAEYEENFLRENPSLGDDREVVELAVANFYTAINYVSSNLQADKDIIDIWKTTLIGAFIDHASYFDETIFLEYFDKYNLHDDINLIISMVTKFPESYQAVYKFKDNQDVISAILDNSRIIKLLTYKHEYESDDSSYYVFDKDYEFCSDKTFMLEAIRQVPKYIQYASDDLKSDKQFAQLASPSLITK